MERRGAWEKGEGVSRGFRLGRGIRDDSAWAEAARLWVPSCNCGLGHTLTVWSINAISMSMLT